MTKRETLPDRFPVSDARAPMAASSDAPPAPPEKPLPMDCCEGGCDRCVFDIYAEELEDYEAALADWRKRNPGCDPDAMQ